MILTMFLKAPISVQVQYVLALPLHSIYECPLFWQQKYIIIQKLQITFFFLFFNDFL